MSDFQALGTVDDLLPLSQEDFAYPEFASVTSVLSDGSSAPNYVLQSSAPPVRQAMYTWSPVGEADKNTIKEYDESKDEVPFILEDGTTRTVVVMDFASSRRFDDQWTVTARLLEATGPTPPGS